MTNYDRDVNIVIYTHKKKIRPQLGTHEKAIQVVFPTQHFG